MNNQIIKINEREYSGEYIYELVDSLVRKGDLVKLRQGEFFWTKKSFVKTLLGFSKIVPFPNKIRIYLFAFSLQFTNLYSLWTKSRISRNNC